MITLNDLDSCTQKNINGKWVAARPIVRAEGSLVASVLSRLKDAWAVFRGVADAFAWPEGQ